MTAPSTEQEPVAIRPLRYEEPPLFFRTQLANGEKHGVSFEIDTTIGLGGALLIATVEQEGKPRTVETIDLQNLISAWINQIVSTT